jgi:hypothetical protein
MHMKAADRHVEMEADDILTSCSCRNNSNVRANAWVDDLTRRFQRALKGCFTNAPYYSGIVSFTSATMSGGRTRCPWYLLLAHAAWAPDNPWRYAEIKRADLFANLQTGLSFRIIKRKGRTFEFVQGGRHQDTSALSFSSHQGSFHGQQRGTVTLLRPSTAR